MKKIFFKGRLIFIPLAVAAFLSLISLAVMALWNNLLPGLLHVGIITFWQAMGIFILCKILFGFGRGGRGAPWMRHKMNERFKNMTPDEKEQFKQKMQQRFGEKCGFGNRHPFETEWDNNAPAAVNPAE